MSAAAVLRTSPLAAHVSEQVYVRGRQGWGGKAHLPTALPCTYVTFARLDTPYDISGFRSADHKVGVIARWKEHFTTVIRDGPYLASNENASDRQEPTSTIRKQPTNVALMSDREFRRYVDNVQRRAPFWRAKMATQPYKPWYDVLNIRNSVLQDGQSITQVTYLPPQSEQTKNNVTVEGRIIGKLSSRYVVGLGGVTANLLHYMPGATVNRFYGNSKARRTSADTQLDKQVKEFIVRDAYWDSKARPVVNLTTKDNTFRSSKITSRFTALEGNDRHLEMSKQISNLMEKIGKMHIGQVSGGNKAR